MEHSLSYYLSEVHDQDLEDTIADDVEFPIPYENPESPSDAEDSLLREVRIAEGEHDNNEGEDIETDNDISAYQQRTDKLRAALESSGGVQAVVESALKCLNALNINLPLLLDYISYSSHIIESRGNNPIRVARSSLLGSKELPHILRRWESRPTKHGKGMSSNTPARATMRQFSVDMVKQIFVREISEVKEHLKLKTKEITRDVLLGIDFNVICKQIKSGAPTMFECYRAAAWSPAQESRNTLKSPDKMVCFQISTAIAFRHEECSSFKKQMTFYMRSNGLSAKGTDTLSSLGLTMNQKWSYAILEYIAKRERQDIRAEIRKSNISTVITHDNVDLMKRVHEQRVDNKDQLTHGTAIVAYVVPQPSADNRALQAQRRSGGKLDAVDILKLDSSKQVTNSIRAHHIYHILQALFRAKDFGIETYQHRHSEILQVPASTTLLDPKKDGQPRQIVLDALLQEEASNEGNLRILEHVLKILGFDSSLGEKKRLGLEIVLNWVGDQATISKMRRIPQWHADEKNSYTRTDYLNTLGGFLHYQINWLQGLHIQYQLSGSHLGLEAATRMLERKGLRDPATKGTYFNTLEQLYMHVGDSHLRGLWLTVSDCEDLVELHNKSAEELRQIATKIYDQYASTKAVARIMRKPEIQRDYQLLVIVQFLRDWLNYIEFDDAMAAGDPGRMRDMLPRLFFQFSGGPNPKYAIEVLELLQGFERDWPKDLIDYVMKYCMLVNPSGRPRKWIPLDEAQEHVVRHIKSTFAAQGPNATWEYINKIAPAIPTMCAVMPHIEATVNAYRRYSKHNSPSAEEDIKGLTNYYFLHDFYAERPRKAAKCDAIIDYARKGSAKLVNTEYLAKWHQERTWQERQTSEIWDMDEQVEGDSEQGLDDAGVNLSGEGAARAAVGQVVS